MRNAPTFPNDRLTVISWPDERLARQGHDPRSRYVEKYWLGVLGPSTTWLLRHLADELEASPNGFVMDLNETALRLGIPRVSRYAPFNKALARLVQFELAKMADEHTFAVRRHIPTLSARHVARLPEHLRSQHDHAVRLRLQDAS